MLQYDSNKSENRRPNKIYRKFNRKVNRIIYHLYFLLYPTLISNSTILYNLGNVADIDNHSGIFCPSRWVKEYGRDIVVELSLTNDGGKHGCNDNEIMNDENFHPLCCSG